MTTFRDIILRNTKLAVIPQGFKVPQAKGAQQIISQTNLFDSKTQLLDIIDNLNQKPTNTPSIPSPSNDLFKNGDKNLKLVDLGASNQNPINTPSITPSTTSTSPSNLFSNNRNNLQLVDLGATNQNPSSIPSTPSTPTTSTSNNNNFSNGRNNF